jgi:DNA-binding NarL/FixJ family response regulator
MGSQRRRLAPRHQRVADLVNGGRSTAEIASELGLTVNIAEYCIAVGRKHDRVRAAEAIGVRPALTARGAEVAELLKIGATNGEIAQRRRLSVRTLETHVGQVLRKLGVASGADVAEDVAPETGIGALWFRELEVLHLLARGLPQEGIADRLNVDRRTIESHVYAIRKRFGMKPPDHRRA